MICTCSARLLRYLRAFPIRACKSRVNCPAGPSRLGKPHPSSQVLTRGTDGQGGVQDPFLLSEVIGELLDLRRRSAYEDHLSTQVMVEVHINGSQDGVIVVMLQLD